ncbi:sel1 repeat family protein, partial [Myxococcota bacterium]|nr:sel1 repeat family protein [Myxococcota bacterium]
ITKTKDTVHLTFHLPRQKFARVLQLADLLKLRSCTDPKSAETFACPEISQEEMNREVARNNNQKKAIATVISMLPAVGTFDTVLQSILPGEKTYAADADLSLIKSTSLMKQVTSLYFKQQNSCLHRLIFSLGKVSLVYRSAGSRLFMLGYARALKSKFEACVRSEKSLKKSGPASFTLVMGKSRYGITVVDDHRLLLSSMPGLRVSPKSIKALSGITVPDTLYRFSATSIPATYKDSKTSEFLVDTQNLDVAFIGSKVKKLYIRSGIKNLAAANRVHTSLVLYTAMMRKDYPHLIARGFNPLVFARDLSIFFAMTVDRGTRDAIMAIMEVVGAYAISAYEAELREEEKVAALADSCKKKKETCHLYALHYLNKKTDEGTASALPLLKKNCLRKVYPSCFVLGDLYRDGTRVKNDRELAHKYLNTACRGGELGACYRLGYYWGYRGKTKKDRRRGEEAYGFACSRKRGNACFFRARVILRAQGDKGWGRAAPFFKKACDLNYQDGCHSYGYYLSSVRSRLKVKPDHKKAMELYLVACGKGLMMSCNNVGDLYEKGWGVSVDTTRALKYYRMACDGKDSMGCLGVADVYTTLKNYSMAFTYRVKACEMGRGYACYQLAGQFQNGQHVVKDLQKARVLLKRACSLKYTKACP